MAYSTTNPPVLVAQPVGGPRQWEYRSTDAVTVVRVNGYITNAKDLGMKAGDVVRVVDTDASPVASSWVNVVAINANGSGDLSDGAAITATNTD